GNQPLNDYTYTRFGGQADYFVTPETYNHVQEVVKLSNRVGVPFTLVGNGSNLIIKDGGIRGIVMNLSKLNRVTTTGTTIVSQSGARIIDVSREALANNLTGLEFACGIPGSVGGALFMNAGAYGGEIKDVLISTIVVDQQGELLELQAEDLDLAYRTSNIPQNGYIVLEATFTLKNGVYDAIKDVMYYLSYKFVTKLILELPYIYILLDRL